MCIRDSYTRKYCWEIFRNDTNHSSLQELSLDPFAQIRLPRIEKNKYILKETCLGKVSYEYQTRCHLASHCSSIVTLRVLMSSVVTISSRPLTIRHSRLLTRYTSLHWQLIGYWQSRQGHHLFQSRWCHLGHFRWLEFTASGNLRNCPRLWQPNRLAKQRSSHPIAKIHVDQSRRQKHLR